MRRGGVQYFYIQDAQGNVSGLVNASGAVVETYAYTPHGVLVGGGGSGITNPHRFKGREWDAESGLYYMRARYYDAGLGRFLSEDPIGLAGGLNLYLFVAGDPVNYADPSGLAPECMGTWALVQVDESPFAPHVWRCQGATSIDPMVITPRGRGSFFFMSSNPRGAYTFSGGDAQDALWLLGSGGDAMTTAITMVPVLAAQGTLRVGKVVVVGPIFLKRSMAQIARRGWSTARRHFWKAHEPAGIAPRREVLVRDTRTGVEYTRWETMEVHHRRSLKNGGGHEFGNLEARWPTHHAEVDSDRRVGYIVLKIIRGPW